MERRLPVTCFQLIFLVGSWFASASAEAQSESAKGGISDARFFEQQIRPLFARKCTGCHGPEDQNGGLRLDARAFAFKGGDSGPVIVPGKSTKSLLWDRVTSADESDRMPPEGPRLTPDQLRDLRNWIDQGAVWLETDHDREAAIDKRRDHWAFQPLPDRSSDSRTLAEKAALLDAMVRKRLIEAGLGPNPPAGRRTLIRRLAFDLHGLPPDPAEVQQFTNSDHALEWAELVERFLSSPRYGERWAQHWLDVVRYADTHGFEVNTPRENAWPYRDFVIASLNDDKPFDQFIREQLAGDVLKADAGTGFLVAAAVLLPGQIGADDESKRLARQDALDEIIQGTSATLLGLSLGCARCHDHKFDPLSQQDYYAFQAFFAGVEYGDRAIRDEEFLRRQTRLPEVVRQIEDHEQSLIGYEPVAFTGRTIILDEEDESVVRVLVKPNGPGANPAGNKRGYRDDPGSPNRLGNISRGRYTWWNNQPGQDVLAYVPGHAGRYRLWISWGAHGSGVHTRDARYVLDLDGDPDTRNDQKELATVDQYYPAGVESGETEKTPLWSGLLNVGVIELGESSTILVRGGETGQGITADVIVLQEQSVGKAVAKKSSLPRFRAPISPRLNIERFRPVEARHVRFTSFETIDQNRHEPCLDELEVFAVDAPAENVALASAGAEVSSSGNYSDTGKHQLKHINDGRYGNSFSWISNEQGKGWVQITLPVVQRIERIEWARDREGKFPDRLPVRYRIDVSVDGTNWNTVATDSDRTPRDAIFDPVLAVLRNPSAATDAKTLRQTADALKELKAEKLRIETPRMVYAGRFRDPDTTRLLRRGDPEQPLQTVEPSIPALFQAPVDWEAARSRTEGEDPARRFALADWIASSRNPLTSRVMVNRIWQYHFGTGLVSTPSDFGLNGSRPSHPELLDWLAGEFIDSGWSIKHVHRLILLSKTFQQSHRIQPDAYAVDRGNRLLWRYSSRRLEAEAIRDSMLAVSGELNLTMGGPGFDFFQTRGGLSGFPPVKEFGPERMRRMIYAHRIRMEPVPVFGAFDCPDAGQATPTRGNSTTAIQALNLMNSPFVLDRAAAFAARIEADSKNANAEEKVIDRQIDRAFELALGRQPTASERSPVTTIVNQHGLATLCRALLNSNEFLFLP